MAIEVVVVVEAAMTKFIVEVILGTGEEFDINCMRCASTPSSPIGLYRPHVWRVEGNCYFVELGLYEIAIARGKAEKALHQGELICAECWDKFLSELWNDVLFTWQELRYRRRGYRHQISAALKEAAK